MQSLRDIKRRMRSVKNIAQITKAMEVVSMTKMRRSQSFALAARPYALASLDLLKNLLSMTPSKHLPEMLKGRTIQSALLVVITADKGLVGGFNENVLRKAEKWVADHEEKHIYYQIITVGRKAKDFFERKNIATVEDFTEYGDYTEFADTKPVADVILEGFDKKQWDSVDVIYTHFKTTLTQETLQRSILPVTEKGLQEIIEQIVPDYGRFSGLKNEDQVEQKSPYNYTYAFEPSPEKIIYELVEDLVRVAFHHVMLESNASEHSARMVTMKNASDNATDLREKLNVQFNKGRQAAITSEISEIIAGAEALS